MSEVRRKEFDSDGFSVAVRHRRRALYRLTDRGKHHGRQADYGVRVAPPSGDRHFPRELHSGRRAHRGLRLPPGEAGDLAWLPLQPDRGRRDLDRKMAARRFVLGRPSGLRAHSRLRPAHPGRLVSRLFGGGVRQRLYIVEDENRDPRQVALDEDYRVDAGGASDRFRRFYHPGLWPEPSRRQVWPLRL